MLKNLFGKLFATELERLTDEYKDIKIGQVAQKALKPILENGTISANDFAQLQSKEHSKTLFNINYPLLVKADSNYDKARYYSDPIKVGNTEYVLCSQWIEKDRNKLLQWIVNHK